MIWWCFFHSWELLLFGYDIIGNTETKNAMSMSLVYRGFELSPYLLPQIRSFLYIVVCCGNRDIFVPISLAKVVQ
jgi:hypothetical protein